MLSPYMSPVERIWYYALRTLCGLVLVFGLYTTFKNKRGALAADESA